MDELKNSLNRRDQTCQKYLKEIQETKDANRALETKFGELEKEKNQTELDLLYEAQNNGNTSTRIEEIQNMLDEANFKNKVLKEKLQAEIDNAKKAA